MISDNISDKLASWLQLRQFKMERSAKVYLSMDVYQLQELGKGQDSLFILLQMSVDGFHFILWTLQGKRK